LSLWEAAGTLYASFYDDAQLSQVTAHSTDGGETWIAEAGADLLPTGVPVMMGDHLLVPVADRPDRLFVEESGDGGATWTPRPFDVAGGAFGDNSLDDVSVDNHIVGVRILADNGVLDAVFPQGDGPAALPRLGFARSQDHGATWPAGDVVTAYGNPAGTSYLSEDAAMALATEPKPAILVAFFDGDHLRVLRSTDGGATWP
jgi:hypothetical protein